MLDAAAREPLMVTESRTAEDPAMAGAAKSSCMEGSEACSFRGLMLDLDAVIFYLFLNTSSLAATSCLARSMTSCCLFSTLKSCSPCLIS